MTYEKIKMVINYEVEPLLPFELDDAVIDFIITKTLPDEGSSEIIVAAAQKSSIAEHISFFEHAGVSPHKIDVDVFALYGLYTRISAYRTMSGGVAFVDIGSKTSRVLFMRDAQLKAVRVLPTGMDDFVTAVTNACGISRQEARVAIDTFGFTKKEDQQYHQALTDSLTNFFKNGLIKFVTAAPVFAKNLFKLFVRKLAGMPEVQLFLRGFAEHLHTDGYLAGAARQELLNNFQLDPMGFKVIMRFANIDNAGVRDRVDHLVGGDFESRRQVQDVVDRDLREIPVRGTLVGDGIFLGEARPSRKHERDNAGS